MSPRNFVPPRPNSTIFCIVTLVLTAALINSCASLTKEQCLNGDWKRLGYQDGYLGRSHGFFQRHVKACERFLVLPDKLTWLAGHKIGARKYCEPENAFKQGLMGRGYNGICEPDQHKAFVVLHNLGYREYRIIQSRDYYAREVARLENSLDEKEAYWDKVGLDASQTQEQRSYFRDQIDFARRRQMAKSDELANFRRRLQAGGTWQIEGLNVRVRVNREAQSYATE